ncbi:hypothetical protein OG311_20810 [Streptomyces sp. NBC_01343]|uniref:hypothetical protein n=1 Tax=Streptomyces sp. NBC_01343 TaxID=2903832 RepID=UPI002E0E9DF7|nr:hypothetical protein OG311_20810 [Streptomyces sp. NBC_01343]
MNEQDSDPLGSFRESSAFELAIMTAGSKAAFLGVLHEYELSEEDFTNGFPELAKVAQGLPDVPDEASPSI